MELYNLKHLEAKRRELRKQATEAEQILWEVLRSRKLEGFKFRRQYSIGNYIVDFYCPSARLVIELDGQHHFTEEGQQSDFIRDSYLQSLSITVIRFENYLVTNHLDSVVEAIKIQLQTIV